MRAKENYNSIVEICPIRNVIARFGNKWAFLVLTITFERGVVRFNELCHAIPDVSSRVLSATLKTLEADGLVERHAYPTVPPRVEYQLTDTGRSLMPLINQITVWAQNNMPYIKAHRQEYQFNGQ